ncbi:MAG: hypothetical protein U9R19_09600, partial [Bacteroidota bacterium]|nr:hypothetical protein [Bacteroidota bacterium]
EIIEKLTLRAQDQGLELFYNIDADIPNNIIGDKARINQFISLLTENSLLITNLTNRINESSGGKINLELKQLPDSKNLFRISVVDNSIPFKSSNLREVHQYYSYYNDMVPYAGLKLKIIAGLAEIIGSKLEFESTDRNSFYIDLKYECL